VGEETTPEVVVHAPGYKSTEFWLSLAAVLAGFILASGAVVEGSLASTIVGGVLTVLGVLGYTNGRTAVKIAEEQCKREEARGTSFVAYAAEKVKGMVESRKKSEADAAAARLTAEAKANELPAVEDGASDVLP